MAYASNDDDLDFNVFISYHRNSTRAQAIQLQRNLESRGIVVWRDDDQLRAGLNKDRLIDEGIENSQVFICCFNKHYRNSDSCLGELNLAKSLDKQIVPLMIDQTKTSIFGYLLIGGLFFLLNLNFIIF